MVSTVGGDEKSNNTFPPVETVGYIRNTDYRYQTTDFRIEK